MGAVLRNEQTYKKTVSTKTLHSGVIFRGYLDWLKSGISVRVWARLIIVRTVTFLSVGRAVIPNYEQAIQSKQKGVGRFRSVLHEAGKAWLGPKIAAKESKESSKEKAWVIVDWSIWPIQTLEVRWADG